MSQAKTARTPIGGRQYPCQFSDQTLDDLDVLWRDMGLRSRADLVRQYVDAGLARDAGRLAKARRRLAEVPIIRAATRATRRRRAAA